MNATANNPVLDQFIIETVLINPVKDIVSKLEKKEFRDCDIKWLNDRLYKFTNFAAETLGKKFGRIDLVSNDGLLNEYKTNEFIKAFTTLLNYFKSF
jgi:hypothetical protein